MVIANPWLKNKKIVSVCKTPKLRAKKKKRKKPDCVSRESLLARRQGPGGRLVRDTGGKPLVERINTKKKNS